MHKLVVLKQFFIIQVKKIKLFICILFKRLELLFCLFLISKYSKMYTINLHTKIRIIIL